MLRIKTNFGSVIEMAVFIKGRFEGGSIGGIYIWYKNKVRRCLYDHRRNPSW
jgi:hypothetical protein